MEEVITPTQVRSEVRVSSTEDVCLETQNLLPCTDGDTHVPNAETLRSILDLRSNRMEPLRLSKCVCVYNLTKLQHISHIEITAE